MLNEIFHVLNLSLPFILKLEPYVKLDKKKYPDFKYILSRKLFDGHKRLFATLLSAYMVGERVRRISWHLNRVRTGIKLE